MSDYPWRRWRWTGIDSICFRIRLRTVNSAHESLTWRRTKQSSWFDWENGRVSNFRRVSKFYKFDQNWAWKYGLDRNKDSPKLFLVDSIYTLNKLYTPLHNYYPIIISKQKKNLSQMWWTGMRHAKWHDLIILRDVWICLIDILIPN